MRPRARRVKRIAVAGFASRNRVVLLFFAFLAAADWGIGRFAAVWDRHSPDDYAARVNGCKSRPRDTVFVGGSPVAEGIDPDRIPGANYAVGLSGGTTSDFYHAVVRACPTPPKALVYGMTATDINDARGEPHGPASLMSWADVREWRRLRPDNAEWVTRHYLLAKLRESSSVFHHRHGIRMWATTNGQPHELRDYADALRGGNGYAPLAQLAERRYDVAKAAGAQEAPMPFFAKYRTGSHLKYLHKLIDWCESRGVSLVVVDMPVTTDIEAKYAREYAEYRQRLQEIHAARGVRVIWACDETNLPDASFADRMHLNRDGARAFSDWLGVRLKEEGTRPRTPREIPPEAPTPAAQPAPAAAPVAAKTADAPKLIFASRAFFIFLPVVLLLYHTLRSRSHKYNVLLVASWLFYAWISPQYLWVIVLLTVTDFYAALKIDGTDDERTRRRWLWFSVVSNLGLLSVFKYTAFAYDNVASLAQLCGVSIADRHWNILLPLGISFHTFQGISYTLDVYRRQIKAVASFRDYALFVAFWPQLAAGPIVRAVEFLPQMVTPPRVTARHVADGLHFFLLGLFKKLFIADQLDALFVSPVFSNPGAFDPAAHRWACLAWAAQIYCDFSGYSDMAVGCALWFGFRLPRNFNFPYLATSITDFWRRWHISLSTWLRDYVYFPLGGSRGSAARTYFNLTAIFVLCGLWHGATWAWLVYGLYNGLLMSLHRAYDRTLTGVPWADRLRASRGYALFAWACTLWLVMLGLVLIRMADWPGGVLMMRSLLGVDVLRAWSAAVPAWVPGLLAMVAVGHLFSGLRKRECGLKELPSGVRAAVYAGVVVLLVTLAPGVTKTFIYIQF